MARNGDNHDFCSISGCAIGRVCAARVRRRNQSGAPHSVINADRAHCFGRLGWCVVRPRSAANVIALNSSATHVAHHYKSVTPARCNKRELDMRPWEGVKAVGDVDYVCVGSHCDDVGLARSAAGSAPFRLKLRHGFLIAGDSISGFSPAQYFWAGL